MKSPPTSSAFWVEDLVNFYATGSVAGIQPDHTKRLRMLIAVLDTAATIQDMDCSRVSILESLGKVEFRVG